MENIMFKNAQDKRDVIHFINLSEKWRHSYLWKPPMTAHERRKTERENSFKTDFTLSDGTHVYLSFNVECSCNNFYLRKKIYVNDEKKDLRFVKKIRQYSVDENTNTDNDFSNDPF